MRHGYPTFVDMMGFQNDENVNEFLENVFEGHVREGTEFDRAQEQRYQSQCIIRYNFKHKFVLSSYQMNKNNLTHLYYNCEHLF